MKDGYSRPHSPGVAPKGPSRSDRSLPVLAAVLIVAVTAGMAATFVSAPAVPVETGPGPVYDSFTVVADIAEALVLLVFGVVVALALFSDRPNRSPGIPAMILALFLVGISFLVLVRLVAPGGRPAGASSNATGGATTPSPAGNNSSFNLTGSGGYGPLPWGPVPGWIVYVGLAVAVVVVVLLLAPMLRRRLGPEGEEEAATPVRRSLEAALRSLAEPESTDARKVVLALYARLLENVGPYVDDLDAATPREIERVCVGRFGIEAAHAGDLTRLFEEARYSSHPFSNAQAVRARAALAASLDDLRIRSHAGGA
jgi:hypothetical protein